MIRRTTPAPVFSKDPVAVLNHVKELPPPGRLFGESVATKAVSLAVGAVLAAFTVAVFVPSVTLATVRASPAGVIDSGAMLPFVQLGGDVATVPMSTACFPRLGFVPLSPDDRIRSQVVPLNAMLYDSALTVPADGASSASAEIPSDSKRSHVVPFQTIMNACVGTAFVGLACAVAGGVVASHAHSARGV